MGRNFQQRNSQGISRNFQGVSDVSLACIGNVADSLQGEPWQPLARRGQQPLARLDVARGRAAWGAGRTEAGVVDGLEGARVRGPAQGEGGARGPVARAAVRQGRGQGHSVLHGRGGPRAEVASIHRGRDGTTSKSSGRTTATSSGSVGSSTSTTSRARTSSRSRATGST